MNITIEEYSVFPSRVIAGTRGSEGSACLTFSFQIDSCFFKVSEFLDVFIKIVITDSFCKCHHSRIARHL